MVETEGIAFEKKKKNLIQVPLTEAVFQRIYMVREKNMNASNIVRIQN
jgi:hypothetical protein